MEDCEKVEFTENLKTYEFFTCKCSNSWDDEIIEKEMNFDFYLNIKEFSQWDRIFITNENLRVKNNYNYFLHK